MRSYVRRLFIFSILLVFSTTPVVIGAEPSDAISQIRMASTSYVEALNRGDPEAIAEFWTEEGTFVDAFNSTHQARSLVRQEFSKDRVAEGERRVAAHKSTIRFITPDVAIEQGIAEKKHAQDLSDTKASYLAIWVKSEGDRWLLDYLKELSAPIPSQEGPLAELGWMVGQWESEVNGGKANLSVSWSDEKKYLLQKFTLQLPDQAEVRGEQRIAWDLRSEQIRSWLFRSDGSFVEGFWVQEGDAWVVKKVGVTAEGEETTTVNIWVYEAPGSCWFKSLNAKVGEIKADEVIIQFTRVESK